MESLHGCDKIARRAHNAAPGRPTWVAIVLSPPCEAGVLVEVNEHCRQCINCHQLPEEKKCMSHQLDATTTIQQIFSHSSKVMVLYIFSQTEPVPPKLASELKRERLQEMYLRWDPRFHTRSSLPTSRCRELQPLPLPLLSFKSPSLRLQPVSTHIGSLTDQNPPLCSSNQHQKCTKQTSVHYQCSQIH